MILVTETLLQRICDQVVYLCDPQEIILFGSFASGNRRNDSDIDLLIVGSNLQNRQLMSREITGFIAQLGLHADIILLSTAEHEAEMKDAKSFLFNALKNSR